MHTLYEVYTVKNVRPPQYTAPAKAPLPGRWSRLSLMAYTAPTKVPLPGRWSRLSLMASQTVFCAYGRLCVHSMHVPFFLRYNWSPHCPFHTVHWAVSTLEGIACYGPASKLAQRQARPFYELRVISWSAAAAAAKSLQSCPTLCDPTDGSPPGSPSLGFSRQEHWSGLPFPSPMHDSEK